MRKHMDLGSREAKIYLDHAAATPVRMEVIESIKSALLLSANPSSIHGEGAGVRSVIERARKNVAANINGLAHEIIFTSGSTEGLNIAIQGVVKEARNKHGQPHVITSAVEHPSILETLRVLETEGFEVTYLLPDESGVIAEKDLAKALKPETVLVALSYVNSEIGNVLSIPKIVKTIRSFRRNETGERYPYFLLDATQAVNVFELNVEKLGVDMLVLDGSKAGGLKGSGLLYIKDHVAIAPILFGGGQERGLRPGTPSVLAVESLRVALELSQKEAKKENQRLGELSDFFVLELRKNFPHIVINGDTDNLAPHIVSVCFPGLDAEWLVLALDARGISTSRGSACKSGKGNESESLRIINPRCAESSVRFSFGRETIKSDISKVIEELLEIVPKETREENDYLV